MKQLINQYKHTLSLKECDSIIEWIETVPLEPGRTGDGVNLKYKESLDKYVLFTDKNPVNEIIARALFEGISKYKKSHPELQLVGQWGVDTQYNLQKYLPGKGYYATHCEANNLLSSPRMIAWMIYLNTIPLSGGTEFPILKKKIKAEAGKLVIWPAYWTHMHTGIISQKYTKYIATGWFCWSSNTTQSWNQYFNSIEK